ncbi:MAG: phosphopantothenoylcysteine decarboxylase [Acidimicrobiales bacterium]
MAPGEVTGAHGEGGAAAQGEAAPGRGPLARRADAVVEVETADEMAKAVMEAAAGADVVVMAAVVADYRAATISPQKMKKSGAPLRLELVPTVDILAELGAARRPGQVVVGFAAETATGEELVRLGRAKLQAKGADFMVANEVGSPEAGLGHDRSRAVIVSRGSTRDLGLVDKRAVASGLVDAVSELLRAQQGGARA